MKKTIKALYAALLISVGLCAAGNESLAQTYCPGPPGFDNMNGSPMSVWAESIILPQPEQPLTAILRAQ